MKSLKKQVDEFKNYVRGLNDGTPLDHRVELFHTIGALWEELGKFPDITTDVCKKLNITPQFFSACVDNPDLIKRVERLGRHVRGGWLQDYLEWTATHEAPEEFHLWNGLAVLASAVRRKAAIVSSKYTIYPNQWIFTISAPGTIRKTAAARNAAKLIRSGTTCPVFEGKPTPEYIAQQIRKREEGSQFTMFSPETRVLLGQERYMSHLFPFLQEMWDCPDHEWEVSTKSQGKAIISKGCMTFLGCMNPVDVPVLMARNAGQSGFWSRVICIYMNESPREEPLPRDESDRDRFLEESMVERLRTIEQMEFQKFTFSEDGAEWWKPQYSSWKNMMKTADRSGIDFLSRQDVHIQKVGMLLAISERQKPELTADILRRATALVRDAHDKMRGMFNAEAPISFNGEPDVVSLVFRFLDKAGGTLPRQKLLQKTIQNHVFASRLDPTLKFLEQAGMVRSFFGGDDSKTLYYMKVREPNEKDR